MSTANTARREREKTRERFLAGRRSETWFAQQLQGVAKQISRLIDGMIEDQDNDLGALIPLRVMLDRYAETIQPWAQRVVAKMSTEVARRDASAWAQQGKMMGRSLTKEISLAPTGIALKDLLAAQVDEITSLPRAAAERVYKLTVEGISEGQRPEAIAKEIRKTGQVIASRAMMLGRTSVSTTATALVMVRAQHIRSDGYWWRTSRDSDVRPMHKKLEGKFIRWDDPPVVDSNGYRAHAGMSANCRCYPEPEIPDLQ